MSKISSQPADADRLHSAFPTPDKVPPEFKPDTSAYDRLYLLNGEVREWTGPVTEISSPICRREEVGSGPEPRNPGPDTPSRTIIGHAPRMDGEASMAALQAAVKAWNLGRGEWPTMSVAGRVAAVEHFVNRMVEVRDEVVRLLMWEIGKSLEDSRKEFDRTVEYIRRSLEALKDLDRNNSRFTLESGIIAQVRRAPFGVCLSMGPFNYPLNETYTTLIPAIMMGNPVVVKTPKFGTLCHQPILRAFAESFPPGVVNFIYGDGSEIIGPIMQSGDIDVLAFIGSSRVADILKRQHPKLHRMRGVLSLDAKNPGLIMPDADLDLTVKECITGTLSFNGQRCTALKILFVHESIAEAFLIKFSAAVNALPIGMPWEPGVKITPLPELDKTAKMTAFVDDAVAKGARVVNGGGASCGTLFSPAIVYPVSPDAALYSREQFGPVIPVCAYRDEQEFLDYVTDSEFGQQVSIFGSDPRKIGKLVDMLANEVCRVNLNAQCQRGPDSLPFAGRKDSAEGTLSISDALRAFSIRSLVAANDDPSGRELVREIVTGRHSQFLSTDFLF